MRSADCRERRLPPTTHCSAPIVIVLLDGRISYRWRVPFELPPPCALASAGPAALRQQQPPWSSQRRICVAVAGSGSLARNTL